MANVLNLTKKIVTYSQDLTEWKWSEHTLGAIAKAPAYKDTTIHFNDKSIKLDQALTTYQKLQDTKRLVEATALKDLIWSALDDKSNDRIKHHWDIPEAKIASIKRELPEDDAIVAFYALQEENYYNGELSSTVASTYKEPITTWRKVTNSVNKLNTREYTYTPDPTKPDAVYIIEEEVYDLYEAGSLVPDTGVYVEEHIIGSYSEVTFSDYMETSPKYTWLPKVIAIAKQFGIAPNWQPCEHSGKRGLGLTAHDAKELQVIANWYSGLSEIEQEDVRYDWSDMIWLHHENGVDSIQISELEYRSHPEKWADWKETETRDFRCDLYEEEEEEDEE